MFFSLSPPPSTLSSAPHASLFPKYRVFRQLDILMITDQNKLLFF